MACELCVLPVVQMSCSSAYDIWRALSVFRRVREGLRHVGKRTCVLPSGSISQQRSGRMGTGSAGKSGGRMALPTPTEISTILPTPWARGVLCLPGEPRHTDWGLLRLSCDGQAQEPGVADRMSVALCATDPEINAFKPYPKGFLHACTLWGLRPEEVLYVGDRPEVDAVGALNAGMPCVILPLGHVKRDRVICRACIKRFPHSRGYNVGSRLWRDVSEMIYALEPHLWPYIQIARIDHWFKNVFMLLGVLLAWFYEPSLFTWAGVLHVGGALLATPGCVE